MQRLLLPFLLLLLCGMAFAQSGRKPAEPSPSPSPTETPARDKLQLVKSAKPQLPQFVDGERIYTWKEVNEKARVTERPPPRYTPAARRLRTHGYVIVRCILAADETIKHIEVITGLPDGLTESSIDAARRIKFTPAKKDGKPVSVWVELEYRFDIY